MFAKLKHAMSSSRQIDEREHLLPLTSDDAHASTSSSQHSYGSILPYIGLFKKTFSLSSHHNHNHQVKRYYVSFVFLSY